MSPSFLPGIIPRRKCRLLGGLRNALGFSVNLSTVLAIDIVVDDAIVVVEGAAHNIEQGMNGAAGIKAAAGARRLLSDNRRSAAPARGYQAPN